jgi:hypothetical protein
MNESKSDKIRALNVQGLSSREIIAMGYARSTVFTALGKGRVKRPSQAVLEDIVTIQAECLRILRKISGEQPAFELDLPAVPHSSS